MLHHKAQNSVGTFGTLAFSTTSQGGSQKCACFSNPDVLFLSSDMGGAREQGYWDRYMQDMAMYITIYVHEPPEVSKESSSGIIEFFSIPPLFFKARHLPLHV